MKLATLSALIAMACLGISTITIGYASDALDLGEYGKALKLAFLALLNLGLYFQFLSRMFYSR